MCQQINIVSVQETRNGLVVGPFTRYSGNYDWEATYKNDV